MSIRRSVCAGIAGFVCLFTAGGWAIAGAPVVVELFESQGCSSCPPSERVMAGLRREFGDSVALLTFHVDYWDSLGWKDFFSDRRWTERQNMYARAFSQDSMYTPEMVVGGEAGFNGADGRRAQDEVRARLSSSKDPVVLLLSPKSPKTSELSVRLSPGLATEVKELLAVLVEDTSPVHVLRGENRGATMSGDAAVRAVQQMAVPAEGSARTMLTLPPGADPARTRVVVLARGDSPRILAAQVAPWPK